MLTRVRGAKCLGIEAVEVTVEVDVDGGIGIHLVGMADTAVKESLLRTSTALLSSGYKIPGKKIVINLAPADLRKNGSGYDLPIAMGILSASSQESFPNIGDYLIMGELGLDGSVRYIPGALVYAEFARLKGLKGIVLPSSAAPAATEIEGIRVYGVEKLEDAVRLLKEVEDCNDLEVRKESSKKPSAKPEVDFSEILGQKSAKRGMEIAAAGGHNIIMIGPPGSGKTSMAKALTGILPPMSRQEALVTGKIYSVAGMDSGLQWARPFRAPHYSASMAAIIGGGSGNGAIPGEVSLACNGVLFLDEFGQIPHSVAQALRGPLEDRKVVVSRMRSKTEFPASFMLVAASNPCPCGYYGENGMCNCSPYQRSAYMSRLSGPLMDRMDLQVNIRPVPSSEFLEQRVEESSAEIAARVLAARLKQRERFSDEPIETNAEMNNAQIKQYCPLDKDCIRLISVLMDKRKMSMRGAYRIIRVARSIADLAGEEDIVEEHILEAASFRMLDRV